MTPSAETSTGRQPARPRSGGQFATVAVLVVLAVGGFVWSMSIGPQPIGLGTLVKATFVPNHSVPDLVVHLVRLPRALLAALAGAALAVAGLVMQAITRNPLGAPEVLGVNAGAAVVVALATTIVTGLAGFSIVLLSFAGATAAAGVVFGVTHLGRGGFSPVRLALTGSAVSILLYSVLQGVLSVFTSSPSTFFFWLIGGVTYANWSDIHIALPWMLAGFALALLLASRLNVLVLGDDVARGLGQNVGRTRFGGAVCVVLLAGAAVGVAGPIAFIGLLGPHLARGLVGQNHTILVPVSMLIGAAILLYADICTRYLNDRVETPAGLVTAFIGAPFVIYLARRARLGA